MRFLGTKAAEAFAAGGDVRLELGGGERVADGYLGVDRVELPGVDILANLEEPLSLIPDGSVAAVRARHVLEHIREFLPLMQELHRILRPDGVAEIVVPHFSNPYFWSDPTHVRSFGLYTFYHFCDTADQPRRKVPNFYVDCRFRVERLKFALMRESIYERVWRSLVEPLANWSTQSQDRYERRFCRLFPIAEMRVKLRPVK